ncbi:protein tyrosine phosphatase family protein [Verrucomicrobiaceae bacterium R5-34]|nr:protein tyrosine phosphatase family protein [Verrucomicrobiaceae bacterium R5-34]
MSINRILSSSILSLAAAASMLGLSACTSHDHADPKVAELKVKNLTQPQPYIYASGQPTQEQLKELADSGVKHVVNLRPASETDWNEEEHVRSLGMSYLSIPVSGAAGLTKENAKRLDGAISATGKDPAIIHCSSGNRVGGLIAIREATIKGKTKDEAIAEGKRWGLTRMAPAVKAKLTEMGY